MFKWWKKQGPKQGVVEVPHAEAVRNLGHLNRFDRELQKFVFTILANKSAGLRSAHREMPDPDSYTWIKTILVLKGYKVSWCDEKRIVEAQW